MDDLPKDSSGLDFIPDTEKYLKEHIKALQENSELLKSLLNEKEEKVKELKIELKTSEKKHDKEIDIILNQIFSLIINKEWQGRIYGFLLKNKRASKKELLDYCKHENDTELSKYLNNSSVFIDKRGHNFVLNVNEVVKKSLECFIKESFGF